MREQNGERSTNRNWLGEFLRGRRDRLSPRDHGFPIVGRRRSPGLRRDEVAQLAGVSVAYYTWIEQGREINMSADVLNAIARALHLSEDERVHVFTLVGMEVAETPAGDERMHPTIAKILTYGSASWCAFAYDEWFNVLQSTLLAREIIGIDAGRDIESNILYRLFADPSQRDLWVEWESEARIAVGMFRHRLAGAHGTGEGFRLLDTMRTLPEFMRIWEAYDVRARHTPEEFFRREPWQIAHPKIGIVRVHRLAMPLPARAQRTLAFWSAADTETALKFRGLLERAERDDESFGVPA